MSKRYVLNNEERETLNIFVQHGFHFMARDKQGLYVFKDSKTFRHAITPPWLYEVKDSEKIRPAITPGLFPMVSICDTEPWYISVAEEIGGRKCVEMFYRDQNSSRHVWDVLRSEEKRGETKVEYTDPEKQLAKDLYQKGYQYLARDLDGYLWAYHNCPEKSDYNVWLTRGEAVGNALQICNNIIPLFQNVTWSDFEPLKILDALQEKILDDIEIQYLENFLRPFRNNVKSIIKSFSTWYDENGEPHGGENLIISMRGERWDIHLPHFTKNYMYKGMKRGQRYTLAELGLFTEEA